MFIITNNLPISTTNSETFRKLLTSLNGGLLTIPNRHQIADEIESLYNITRLKLQAKLATYKASGGRFSLCIDAWTSKSQHAFLGVSIHFLDSEFRPQNYLLQLADLKRRHTGKYMAKVLVKVLQSFNIDDKIHCITRDNASSNSTLFRAFKDYYWANYGTSYTRAIPCVDHILNLICQDILKYMKATISAKELFNITADTEEIVKEEEASLTESSLTIISSKRDSRGPPTKKVKKPTVKRSSKLAPKGLNAFQKLRYIVGKVRLQQVLIIALVKEITERPSNERRKPTLDSPTRWNSTYKMIIDFMFQLEPITIVMRRYPKEFENLELSASDIEQIKGLGDILAEIEALTILFQGSSYTSMQFVLPLIFNLDTFLNEIIEDTHEELTIKDSQLKEACKLGLLKLNKYFNRTDLYIDEIEPWAIAIILDPRLRFDGFSR